MRIIRLVRVLRVLKLARYSRALRSFGHVIQQKKEELALMTLFLVVLLVMASSSMYFVENEAQPGVLPITPVGKFLGALIALIGIGFFALPAGVLSAAFADELAKRRAALVASCPHCGKAIEA